VSLARELKVGAFVSAGLFVAGLVVFLIGDERHAFAMKDTYETTFEDVQGLTRGSPVRMGGIDVGQVSSVTFPDDPKDRRLRVVMSIVRKEARRIRADSVATIGSKGLLGDKMVVIGAGSPAAPELPPGSVLRSEPPADLSMVVDRLGTISEKADAVMGNLEKTTDTLASPEFREDFRVAVRSLGRIMKKVDEGDGYLSRLLKDPTEAERISVAITGFSQATARLDQTLAGVTAAVARVNQGPGLVHDLLYGEGPAEAVVQVGRAADELATTLAGVRDGNGLARSLLYGDDASQQLIGDLNAITRDVRRIVDGIQAGRGTLGALMVDPSVYEDLKLLLGNVERNRTLRALVRYSIRRDGSTPPVRVDDPEDGRGSTRGKVGAAGRASTE
jgi:phospholipid/cholesterol/gamma-HCH transport system substrate-binding protein